MGIGFKQLFFGDLRPVEYEHMFERLWIFLTESLLALTIFRDDFSVSFIALYSMLVFLKCFHWISADRVDYIDQVPPPGPPPFFHVRLTAVLAILTTFDILLFLYSMEHVMVMGVSAMVLFASEFAILVAAITGTWSRYAVGVMDLRRARGRADAPPWEEKSMYLFYIDLAVGESPGSRVLLTETDFAKLLTYLVFFIVIFLNYGLPVHILRDVYMTLRSFLARGADLVRYRRATRNMDELYPDATAEELDRMGDHTCIICREEMIARERAEPTSEGPNETPKKLACGHIFHFHCLRSWLERQQICPTCRRDVLASNRLPPVAAAVEGVPPPGPAAAANGDGNGNGGRGLGGERPGDGGQEDADRMRSAFEEYFRLPGVNGDAPAMPPPPRPSGPEPPRSSSSDARSASAPPAQTEENEEQRLQRGIWGAPIVPGRFLPPPLGAAPAWPEAGPSRLDLPARSPSTNTRRSGSGHISGSVTPAASQAPIVFSSTGSARSSPRRAPECEASESDIVDEEDVPRFEDDDTSLREVAAAAALRRLGLGSGGGAGRAAQTAGGAGTAGGSGIDKGKGKMPIRGDVDAFDAPVTHKVFLTPQSVPPPHTGVSTSRSPEAARVALDERLRALRDVDHVVWGLVGELSRLRSAWEVEDGHLPASGVGHGVEGRQAPQSRSPDEPPAGLEPPAPLFQTAEPSRGSGVGTGSSAEAAPSAAEIDEHTS